MEYTTFGTVLALLLGCNGAAYRFQDNHSCRKFIWYHDDIVSTPSPDYREKVTKSICRSRRHHLSTFQINIEQKYSLL